MLQKKLKGTGVALVTPFHKDKSIDFKGLEKLVEHVIKNNVDYIVPLGTTAESATMSKDEKSAVQDFILEINAERVPVVLGIGGNNTQEVINCIKRADFSKVDAILSVSPYYNKPSQRGIYEHYKLIASASPVPVILYNVPGRTGSNILPETTLSLAKDFKNIIGIKEASGNLEQVMTIIKNKPKDFLVISGDDALTLPMIAAGGDGVISVAANVYPKEFSEMVKHCLKGNYEKARDLHYSLLEMINLLFVEGNPAGAKAALSCMKICSDHLRLPLVEVSKNTFTRISNFVSTY